MNWIKIEHSLHDKMEVLAIARQTGLSVDEVVGKLVRLWCWEDQHGRECFVKSAKISDLKRLGVTQEFATAMEKVGWLRVLKAGIRFPDIDRHNSQLAKRKALNAERQARHRAKVRNEPVTPGRCTPVTPVCAVGVTRQEETRQDKTRGDKSARSVVAALRRAGVKNPEDAAARNPNLDAIEVEALFAIAQRRGKKPDQIPGYILSSHVQEWNAEAVAAERKRRGAQQRRKDSDAEFGRLQAEFGELDDAEVARRWGLLGMAVKRVPPRANIRADRDNLPRLMRLAKPRREVTP